MFHLWEAYQSKEWSGVSAGSIEYCLWYYFVIMVLLYIIFWYCYGYEWYYFTTGGIWCIDLA